LTLFSPGYCWGIYLQIGYTHTQSDSKIPCRLRTDTHKVRRKLFLLTLLQHTFYIILKVTQHSLWRHIVFNSEVRFILISSSVSWNILLLRVIITLGNRRSWFIWDGTTVCQKTLHCNSGWVRMLLWKRNHLPFSVWKSALVTLSAPMCKIHCKFSLQI